MQDELKARPQRIAELCPERGAQRVDPIPAFAGKDTPSPRSLHLLDRARPSGPAEAPSGAGKILIIDDESAVRSVAREMLERHGFEVLEATGGNAAVELFRERKSEIGAVVLDLIMPGMDGEATFHRLRAIRDDVPVILMSGYSKGDVAARLCGKTRADFLEKPFTPTELTEKVCAQL